MILNLYQSKKLDGYLDEYFYQEIWPSTDLLKEPIFNWYADIMFIHRKKYLIITNGLTKFTFFIFRYSKTGKSYFGNEFLNHLSAALEGFDINPYPYREAIEKFAINDKRNKSSMAHISRLKEEYYPLIKENYYRLSSENDQAYFNNLVNERPTTFNKKTTYEYPYEVMKRELGKRSLV